MNLGWGAFRIHCPKPKRAFTKGILKMSCVQVCAALVSPSAVASPKRLWSGLERWHLAGHEDDKLGLCKVLLWSAIVYNQERLRQSEKTKT